MADDNGKKRMDYGAQKDRVFVRGIQGEYNLTQELKRLRSLPRVAQASFKDPHTFVVRRSKGLTWQDAERRLVRPKVIVSLGATAALSVFGKPMAIGESRQRALPLPDKVQGVVTYHPSYLLRLPDADAKARAYAAFVQDLKFAWRLAAA